MARAPRYGTPRDFQVTIELLVGYFFQPVLSSGKGSRELRAFIFVGKIEPPGRKLSAGRGGEGSGGEEAAIDAYTPRESPTENRSRFCRGNKLFRCFRLIESRSARACIVVNHVFKAGRKLVSNCRNRCGLLESVL